MGDSVRLALRERRDSNEEDGFVSTDLTHITRLSMPPIEARQMVQLTEQAPTSGQQHITAPKEHPRRPKPHRTQEVVTKQASISPKKPSQEDRKTLIHIQHRGIIPPSKSNYKLLTLPLAPPPFSLMISENQPPPLSPVQSSAVQSHPPDQIQVLINRPTPTIPLTSPPFQANPSRTACKSDITAN